MACIKNSRKIFLRQIVTNFLALRMQLNLKRKRNIKNGTQMNRIK